MATMSFFHNGNFLGLNIKRGLYNGGWGWGGVEARAEEVGEDVEDGEDMRAGRTRRAGRAGRAGGNRKGGTEKGGTGKGRVAGGAVGGEGRGVEEKAMTEEAREAKEVKNDDEAFLD